MVTTVGPTLVSTGTTATVVGALVGLAVLVLLHYRRTSR